MRRHSSLLAILFALLPLTSLRASDAPPEILPTPEHGAATASFANDWNSAFLTGNGTIGAMVLGNRSDRSPSRPNEEAILFSHAGLFLPVGAPQVVPVLAENLADMRLAIGTKGYGPAVMSAYAAAQKQNFPGLRYTDPFLPALELNLKMPPPATSGGAARDYLRTENFQTGEIAVRWTEDAGTFFRKIFISRADNVAVLWIGSLSTPIGKPPISCDITVPPIPNVPVRTFSQNNPTAKPADAAANALIQSSREIDAAGIGIHNSYREGKGSGYDAAIRIIPDGGTTEVTDGTLSIKDARNLLVLLRIRPFKQTTSNSDRDLRASLAEIPANYDRLLDAHKKIHQPLFDRISLDLGGGKDRALPTDTLIARANKEGIFSPALLEKLYEGSRYAQICGTGELPPNLLGIWSAQWAPSPMLAGDYAFESSSSLAIMAALSCNTPELMHGLFRLADQSRPDWQLNATNLFGTRGIFVPARQSSTGQNLQWSDRAPANLLWTSGAGIIGHWYYDYFLHTDDRKFLATQAVPFMKQVAEFYEDFLFLDAAGKYRFSPSYSGDDAPGDNSTQEIMVARELLTNLIAACRLLNIEPQSIAHWQKMLDAFPPYLISPEGELQEWALPGVSNKPNHRHLPHLYAIYAGNEFDPNTTPELWKAAHAAYQARLNQWFKPLATTPENNSQQIQDRLVMGLCAARFGEANTVENILTRIAAKNTYPSMMTQRTEDGRSLVADGNAIPELLNSALLHSQPGRLDLLPALPASLPTGEIRGLAARSTIAPIILNRLAWTPKEIQLDLLSPADQSLEITAPSATPQKVTLKSGQPFHITFPRPQ